MVFYITLLHKVIIEGKAMIYRQKLKQIVE